MAVQRSTQPESKLPRATTSTSSLSTPRELAKSNGYSSKHTIQQTNNVEKNPPSNKHSIFRLQQQQQSRAGRKQKHKMHLFCRSSTQTPPEVVKLLLPTSLYSIPARNKNKKMMTTRRKKHMYKSEKKCSLLQVAVARAAADKGRSAYHRTCTYH
jgi:hypothetical protein